MVSIHNNTQREEWTAQGHGVYSEIAEEKEFFEVCKKSAKVVCHFFRESTWRCKIIDKHLLLLAPRHLETRFATLSQILNTSALWGEICLV